MPRNVAYLIEQDYDLADYNIPILVTAVGNYKLDDQVDHIMITKRPNGRKDYQLIYVASGKAQFIFNGVETYVSKGNIVFFRPGEIQEYYLCPEDRAETFWVHFTGSEVENWLKKYEIPDDKNIFWVGSSAKWIWIYNQMIQELQLRQVNYADMLVSGLNQLFMILNRYLQQGREFSNELMDEIERAIRYFSDNYAKPIVIQDYAKERLMTPWWFIQNFKKIAGCTPTQYLVSLRVTNAITLMIETNYNIAQIARSVGYDNPLYFSRLFKKHTGYSPSEYKKRELTN